MKYFRNFLQFKTSNQVFEQQKTKQQTVGGKTEFEVKAKGKDKLPYTKKAKDEIWKGENYNKVWKPAVEKAMSDDATYQKILKYLEEYKGQGKEVVKNLIEKSKKPESGPGTPEYKLRYMIQRLATDGKIGPFHTIVRLAVEKATDEEIVVPEKKESKSKKIIVTVVDKETKKPIPTAKYVLQDGNGKELSSGQVDENAEFYYMVTGPSEFRLMVSAEGYESLDKKITYSGYDEFSVLGSKDEVFRKTVSLLAVKKESEEEQVLDVDGGKKPEFDGLKSETSDQATGHMGEKEKQQIKWEAKGDTSIEKLFSLKYPTMVNKEKDLITSMSIGDTVWDTLRKDDDGNPIEVDWNGQWMENLKYSVRLDLSSVYKGKYFVYFLGTYDGGLMVYQPEVSKNVVDDAVIFKGGDEFNVTVIVSCERINFNYNKKVGKDLWLNEKSAKGFFDNVIKLVRPYSQNDWGGPTFQARHEAHPLEDYKELPSV